MRYTKTVPLQVKLLLVQPEQTVEAGDLIGFVGGTGLSTAPHLHWEVRVAGIAVDPIQWTEMAIPSSVLLSVQCCSKVLTRTRRRWSK